MEKQNAGIVLVIAAFGAFRPVELLVVACNMLSLISLATTHNIGCRIIASMVFLAGVLTLYFASRMRLDKHIFENWVKLDPAGLDMELKKMNPNFEEGRSLESRISGAYRLIKSGIMAATAQWVMMLILAWEYA